MAEWNLDNALRELASGPAAGAVRTHAASGHAVEVLACCLVEKGLVPSVAYRDRTGLVWVRPLAEFVGGKFV